MRCLVDLGLTRRPLLEPNLNASGLACTALGLLGLLVAESILLPLDAGAARNPASTSATTQALEDPLPGTDTPDAAVSKVLRDAPLPVSLKRNPPQVIVSRVLAGLAHLALVVCLYFIGSRIFERPISGLAMAVCYLLTPYSRIAVVDSGQLIPAALLTAAVLGIPPARCWPGWPSAWPAAGCRACLGLVPLWVGFYRGRGASRFLAVSMLVAAAAAPSPGTGPRWPTGPPPWGPAAWERPASWASTACQPPAASGPRSTRCIRLPVVIGYLALVVLVAFWPTEKNLGEVICLSAALLVASQFWYLEEGGTLILLYLPLVLMMMFRPNLASRRPPSGSPARARSCGEPLQRVQPIGSARRQAPTAQSRINECHRETTDRMGAALMLLTYDLIARRIDHSLLGPTMTDEELRAGCELAAQYDVASVCIKPYARQTGRSDPGRHAGRRGHDHRLPARRPRHGRQGGRGEAGDGRRRDRAGHGGQHRASAGRRLELGSGRHRRGDRGRAMARGPS